MPRRGSVERRVVLPDTRFQSIEVARMINKLMQKGKKSKAQRILYGAFTLLEQRTHKNPLEIFRQAIQQVSPQLEVRSRRVGGANYQIPQEVRPERALMLALRWIKEYAKARKGKSMVEKLADEIQDAANGTGGAVKKKQDVHRMAEANRAFAHYRW